MLILYYYDKSVIMYHIHLSCNDVMLVWYSSCSARGQFFYNACLHIVSLQWRFIAKYIYSLGFSTNADESVNALDADSFLLPMKSLQLSFLIIMISMSRRGFCSKLDYLRHGYNKISWEFTHMKFHSPCKYFKFFNNIQIIC